MGELGVKYSKLLRISWNTFWFQNFWNPKNFCFVFELQHSFISCLVITFYHIYVYNCILFSNHFGQFWLVKTMVNIMLVWWVESHHSREKWKNWRGVGGGHQLSVHEQACKRYTEKIGRSALHDSARIKTKQNDVESRCPNFLTISFCKLFLHWYVQTRVMMTAKWPPASVLLSHVYLTMYQGAKVLTSFEWHYTFD